MQTETTYKYADSAKLWTAELFVMFLAGFVAATLLWVGVWYFQARPAQADILRAQETELQQVERQLQQCRADNQHLTEENARLNEATNQLDRALKRAWIAHGRCVQESKQQ